jgi:neutral ceramidase
MELTMTFLAGAAQVEITPPLGTIINGDFKAHYANYIHDALYAKAVVLRKGETQLVIVVIDICVMPKTYVDALRKSIADELGFKFENILISSTHTHAAGSVAEAYLSSVDSGYSRMLPPLVKKAVSLAKNKLTPSKIAFGKVDVPTHVRSRRYELNEYVPTSPVTGKPEKVKTNPFGLEKFINKPSTVNRSRTGLLRYPNIGRKVVVGYCKIILFIMLVIGKMEQFRLIILVNLLLH